MNESHYDKNDMAINRCMTKKKKKIIKFCVTVADRPPGGILFHYCPSAWRSWLLLWIVRNETQQISQWQVSRDHEIITIFLSLLSASLPKW